MMTHDNEPAVETAPAPAPASDSHLLPGEKVDFTKPRKAAKKKAKKAAKKATAPQRDPVPTARGIKFPKTVRLKARKGEDLRASVPGGPAGWRAKPKSKAKKKLPREPRAARGLTKASKPRAVPPASRQPETRGRHLAWPTEVKHLQEMYEEAVGRPIASTSRRYLIMQIRRARAGNPPPGLPGRKLGENPKVIPLRFPREALEALDGYLKHQQITRAEFFTRAACAALKKAKEDTIAAFFA